MWFYCEMQVICGQILRSNPSTSKMSDIEKNSKKFMTCLRHNREASAVKFFVQPIVRKIIFPPQNVGTCDKQNLHLPSALTHCDFKRSPWICSFTTTNLTVSSNYRKKAIKVLDSGFSACSIPTSSKRPYMYIYFICTLFLANPFL